MSDIKRRDFLKVLGATGAGAALTGCNPAATEKIIPYLVPPENTIPGVANWYASICRECPAGCGVRVRTREGRAVKIEGNPEHPVNQGSLCIRGQASLQGLYNPDRIRQPLRRNEAGEFEPISWEDAETLLAEKLSQLPLPGVLSRAAFITPLLTGSLGKLVDEWCSAVGVGQHLRYEPIAYEALREANRICFGQDTLPEYRIEETDFLLSFGADFLETWVSNVDYAGRFAKMRSVQNGQPGRFIHISPHRSLTAANADEWLSVTPGSEMELALGLVNIILNEGLASPSVSQAVQNRFRQAVSAYSPSTVSRTTGLSEEKLTALARAFATAQSGLALPPGVAGSGSNATDANVAVNLLNYVCGNLGRTVVFTGGSAWDKAAAYSDMAELNRRIGKGELNLLLLYDVNPTFTTPQPENWFASLAEKVNFIVSFSSVLDETSSQAHLVLPANTPLESWGDFEPHDGVHGLQQPAMQPIYDTRALGDTLLSLASQVESASGKFSHDDFHAYLQDAWRELQTRVAPQKDFNIFWEEALRRGGFWQNSQPETVRWTAGAGSLSFTEAEREGPNEDAFDLIVYPSLHYYDGRGANRPWLQEVPDAMTKAAWDNWAEIHPDTASALGLEEGEVVTLSSNYGFIELPVLHSKGIHRRAVAVQIGQGHTNFGRYADNRGANPFKLLPAQPEETSGGLRWYSQRVVVQKTGRHKLLADVGVDTQMGREIAQFVPLAALTEKHEEAHVEEKHPDMYADHEHKDYRWGMAIDLNGCTGCNACVAACYAENNIPFAGPEETAKGRDLAWLRIERYYAEEEEEPQAAFLPMMCQQCDNAPCEPVCPVYATYHNPEGLNVQVYNRCVGTRYCSNNCPYKVRSFNWFDYDWAEPLNLQLNPDVTVRTKGVMEKCTFCVQRIAGAKDHAKDQGRKVLDGEVAPACVQTCPSQAIVFGNLDDPDSAVSKMARDPRRYHVLGELNTKPAVNYLKRITHEPLESS